MADRCLRLEKARGDNVHRHRGLHCTDQGDESLAMKLLETHRGLIRPVFAKYLGREVKTMGDAFLLEVDSALQAKKCAAEVQRHLRDYNETVSIKVPVRIGIHAGDVIHRDGDVFGEAVNKLGREWFVEGRDQSRPCSAQYFNVACFSCDIGFTKPNPEAFSTVLERLGTSPGKAAYVGDGGSNELGAAKQAGFGVVVFMEGFVASNGLRTPDELETFRRTADVAIRWIGELPKLLYP